MAWDKAEQTGDAHEPLSVAKALDLANGALESSVGVIKVIGEISDNPNQSKKGYWTINLKGNDVDYYGRATIDTLSVYISKKVYDKNPFNFVEGDEIIVTGKFTVSKQYGKFSLTAFSVQYSGKGKLIQDILQTKKKLEDEGLFARPRKSFKRLPDHVICLTSLATGSKARTDVSEHINPLVHLSFVDCRVEGADSAESIVCALAIAESYRPDAIIIARGGGESGLLGAMRSFNDERVLRAVAGCSVPVLSSVGHTMDVCLCDEIADDHADTPTDAGYKVSVGVDYLSNSVEKLGMRMRSVFETEVAQDLNTTASLADKLRLNMSAFMTAQQLTVEHLASHACLSSPQYIVSEPARRTAELAGRLTTAMPRYVSEQTLATTHLASRLESSRERFMADAAMGAAQLERRMAGAGAKLLEPYKNEMGLFAGKLEALSPVRVLARGYAYAQDENGSYIKEAEDLTVGQNVSVHVAKGSFDAQVTGVHTEVN